MSNLNKTKYTVNLIVFILGFLFSPLIYYKLFWLLVYTVMIAFGLTSNSAMASGNWVLVIALLPLSLIICCIICPSLFIFFTRITITKDIPFIILFTIANVIYSLVMYKIFLM